MEIPTEQELIHALDISATINEICKILKCNKNEIISRVKQQDNKIEFLEQEIKKYGTN